MKLSAEGKLRLAVKLAFLAGTSMAAAPSVYAQEDAPQATQEATGESVQLEALTVTGSRIKQPALTSVSPVTTVSAEEIQYQGTTRIEDLMNSLPQVFAGQGANISNGASGTATVDLRGLGSARTLVLIDGRRMPPGDPALPVADLNFIPGALIERVDVSTGGASAVYGSDAVAGVVNFVMKRDFEGFSLDAQRSGYWHDNDNKTASDLNAARGFEAPTGTTFDGKGWDVSAILGVNSPDAKGNATVYATYRQIDALTQDRRDYSNCTYATRTVRATGLFRDARCGGSYTSETGAFISSAFGYYGTQFGYIGTVDTDANGQAIFRPFDPSNDLFNFAPYNYYQRNDTRYGMGAFAHYEFNEHADVYTELMYMTDQTNAVIAPSGAFGIPYVVPCNGANPLLSDAQLNQLCNTTGAPDPNSTDTVVINYILRRNVEGGGRDDDLTHQSQRIVIGVKGDIVDAWTYDAYAQYGQSTLAEVYRNDFSKVRISRALDVVEFNGQAVCASSIDGQLAPEDPTKGSTDPNCVPWNIWSPGGVTPEALAYLQTPGVLTGHTEHKIASASVAGDLGTYGVMLPTATDGIGVAFGTEYRHEQAVYDTDTAFATGDLAGQGAATIGTGGSFQVKELFTEIRVPIVQGKPGFEELNLEAGYRWSDYSSLEDAVDTYKIGINYAPIKDLALRASYNRAVRAPNIIELFAPTRVALDGVTDPCATNVANTPGCMNDPLAATRPELFDADTTNGRILANPAGQYNGLFGTSEGLTEETADTYTAGFVFTPTFVRGLSLTVDYYNIKVEDLISGYGADTILASCYATPGQPNEFCDLINRNPSNGSLWQGDGYVTDLTLNTGALKVEGVDITGRYKVALTKLGLPDIGSLTVDVVATRADHYEVTPITNGDSYECTGLYGTQCGQPSPKWRGKVRTTWGMPWMDSTVSLQWRYFDSVEFDGNKDAVSPADAELGSQSYIDLYASSSPVQGLTLEIGLNNLFDREPPIQYLGLGNGNTFSQVYDSLGTYVFGGVKLEF